MLKHTQTACKRGFQSIPKKRLSAKVAAEIIEKLNEAAKKQNRTISALVNTILTEHFTQAKQTFFNIWKVQPKSLYCPLYGWSEFDKILSDCSTCKYRTGQGRKRCPMWFSPQPIYSKYTAPEPKIKHRKWKKECQQKKQQHAPIVGKTANMWKAGTWDREGKSKGNRKGRSRRQEKQQESSCSSAKTKTANATSEKEKQ